MNALRRRAAKLLRYGGLFKRSVHLRFALANLLSAILPHLRQRRRAWPDVSVGRV